MTGTDPNDDWADLSRELGVDESAAAGRPKAARRDEPAGDDADAEVVELTAAADGGDGDEEADGFAAGLDDEADGGPDDAEGEAGDQSETGEDGEPRKKRRRRRRRKKGKAAAGQPAAPGAEGFAEPGGDAAPEADDDGPGEFAGGDFEEDPEPAQVSTAGGAEDEGTSPEAARELIANWNVPSWDQIVAGLYRPG